MKITPATTEKIKFIGGALVVVAAAFIMFPGFLSVALGLWRILLIVVVAGGACLALAHLTRRIARLKAPDSGEPQTGINQIGQGGPVGPDQTTT